MVLGALNNTVKHNKKKKNNRRKEGKKWHKINDKKCLFKAETKNCDTYLTIFLMKM